MRITLDRNYEKPKNTDLSSTEVSEDGFVSLREGITGEKLQKYNQEYLNSELYEKVKEDLFYVDYKNIKTEKYSKNTRLGVKDPESFKNFINENKDQLTDSEMKIALEEYLKEFEIVEKDLEKADEVVIEQLLDIEKEILETNPIGSTLSIHLVENKTEEKLKRRRKFIANFIKNAKEVIEYLESKLNELLIK